LPFSEDISRLDFAALRERIEATTSAQVERALRVDRPGPDQVAALLSPAASGYMAAIRERASAMTLQRFGRVINLYAPVYLSNHCTNRCLYCGFRSDADIVRADLTLERAIENARVLREQGFRHILLVTGEDHIRYGVDRIEQVVVAIGDLFHSISIEVFPMSADDYARLAGAGVDGLTLYQETYDPDIYGGVHLAGRKRDWARRLEAMEHGGEARFRTLGIGSLLGLAPWRSEAVAMVMHALYLGKRFWTSRVAVSFPRLVPASTGYTVPHPVSDDDLVHMMSVLRLALPDAEMVVSTREPAQLRDGLVGLAVTRMSAGSRTSPDGYVTEGTGEQFSVVDGRSAAEVASMLVSRGHDPVFKDFDRSLR
jgi:2-iminoacetate synthase